MYGWLILLAALQPESADWSARRGQAALALDVQPGNAVIWTEYCLSAWRGGDAPVLKTCRENAPEQVRQTAQEVNDGVTPGGDDAWAARVRIETHFAEARYGEARRAAQRLYELEPQNIWALEAAVLAALDDKDGVMAFALARRGEERFGGVFTGYRARAKQRLDSRGGRGDWLFLGGVMVLVWVSFRQGRRHRRRKRGSRSDVSRLASASASHRESHR